MASSGDQCSRDAETSGGITAEDLDALRKVADEIGPDGLRTFSGLLDAGVPSGEAERILNQNQWIDRFRTLDELRAFHDSLDGGSGEPEFHHLVLFLVTDLGHTVSEAVAEIRNHRPFVLRIVQHHRYRSTYQAVRRWLDVDRLSPSALKRAAEDYHRHGPDGELAKLIRERIEAREAKEAREELDARDAAIRERDRKRPQDAPAADAAPGSRGPAKTQETPPGEPEGAS